MQTSVARYNLVVVRGNVQTDRNLWLGDLYTDIVIMGLNT